MNWEFNKSLKYLWKYAAPFMVLRSTKIFDHGWSVFNMLRLKGYTVAFIFDTSYHSKTLYYLHSHNYYTIGLVPVGLNYNTVDFALPASSDSVFTQLFFVRFLLRINAVAHQTKSVNARNT